MLFKSLNWKTLMLKTVSSSLLFIKTPVSWVRKTKIPTRWDRLWATWFHLGWWWNVTLIWEPFGPIHIVHRSLHLEGRNHRDSAAREAAACRGSCWVSFHGVMACYSVTFEWERVRLHICHCQLLWRWGWWWEVIADTVKNNDRTWERQGYTKREISLSESSVRDHMAP